MIYYRIKNIFKHNSSNDNNNNNGKWITVWF